MDRAQQDRVNLQSTFPRLFGRGSFCWLRHLADSESQATVEESRFAMCDLRSSRLLLCCPISLLILGWWRGAFLRLLFLPKQRRSHAILLVGDARRPQLSIICLCFTLLLSCDSEILGCAYTLHVHYCCGLRKLSSLFPIVVLAEVAFPRLPARLCQHPYRTAQE